MLNDNIAEKNENTNTNKFKNTNKNPLRLNECIVIHKNTMKKKKIKSLRMNEGTVIMHENVVK